MKAFRYRILYAITVCFLILTGLASRKFSAELPLFIAENSGDMLWASMVYFGLRCLSVDKSLPWAFATSLLFSFFIEFSQLYQAAWIIEIRQTTLGALVLGRGFLMVDLLRYLLGISVSFLADALLLKHVTDRSSHP